MSDRRLGAIESLGLCSLALLICCGDAPASVRDAAGLATTDSHVDAVNDGAIVSPDPAVPPSGAPSPSAMGSCEKMDILFVIDDSGSMAEEQENLAANFPRFVEVLNAFQTDAGTSLDYRIGVTTTGRDITIVFNIEVLGLTIPPMVLEESGPAGALIESASCGMTRAWMEREDPNLQQTFSCVAQVGTEGSQVEMPLHMWELAVTERIADGSNGGFLREDALLAVVLLTDEDDCSRPEERLEVTFSDPAAIMTVAAEQCAPTSPALMPVDRFLTAIDTVKGERGRWAVAIIAGPGPGQCTSTFGDAEEAIRLKQFADRVGPNAVFSSICDGDLTSALMSALTTFRTACGSFPPLI